MSTTVFVFNLSLVTQGCSLSVRVRFFWNPDGLKIKQENAKKGIDLRIKTGQVLQALTLVKTFFEKYFV